MEKSSVFNWSYLKNIEIRAWFLAGGIDINNLEKASKISKKIDISSSLEDTPGVKSSKKVLDFLQKVKKKEDINLYKQYIGIADEFLFDSSAMEKSSIFDWSYLKNIEINEWFLAGGININNIEKASRVSRKIDINSGLEDNPGVKSSKKVSDFLLKVKKL